MNKLMKVFIISTFAFSLIGCTNNTSTPPDENDEQEVEENEKLDTIFDIENLEAEINSIFEDIRQNETSIEGYYHEEGNCNDIKFPNDDVISNGKFKTLLNRNNGFVEQANGEFIITYNPDYTVYVGSTFEDGKSKMSRSVGGGIFWFPRPFRDFFLNFEVKLDETNLKSELVKNDDIYTLTVMSDEKGVMRFDITEDKKLIKVEINDPENRTLIYDELEYSTFDDLEYTNSFDYKRK